MPLPPSGQLDQQQEHDEKRTDTKSGALCTCSLAVADKDKTEAGLGNGGRRKGRKEKKEKERKKTCDVVVILTCLLTLKLYGASPYKGEQTPTLPSSPLDYLHVRVFNLPHCVLVRKIRNFSWRFR